MHLTLFAYGLLASLAIALLTAAFTDWRRRQIDNWLNAGIAATAPLFWWACALGWHEIGWQLAAALAALVVCAGLFAIRAMGGGDVKLLTALALWIKPAWFLQLLLLMAVLGGVLTVAFGMWHLARRQRDRLTIPYGLAISAAGLWTIAADYSPIVERLTHAG